MSNHNQIKSSLKHGFTLVEMLIIAPIVILVIGVFVSTLVTITGEVLAVRGSSSMAIDIQAALDKIEQDVKSSGGYLATNNIALTSPQGYNDATGIFQNKTSTNGTMLILNSYAMTGNPLSKTRSFVYAVNQPNACNSPSIDQNTKVMINIVYFVKSVNGVSSLWRRTIMPSTYNNVGWRCSTPWNIPSCTPGYTTPSFCKTNDEKLVDGVQESDFVVNYFVAGSTTADTVANDKNQSDNARFAAMRNTNTVNVTITSLKTYAGRDVTQSGTIRVSTSNDNISANNVLNLSGSGGGNWAYKRPITITNSSGGTLTDYQVQLNPFTDSNFINNTGLVGSWHLNGGTSGSIANNITLGFEDKSGNNNNSITSNTNGAGMNWTTGKFGGAVIFDGIDDVAVVGASPNTATTNWSIEAWIKPTTLPQVSMAIYNGNDSGGYGFGIGDGVGGSGSKLTGLFGAVAFLDSGYTFPSSGQWYHVVMTRDASTTKFYVNGTQTPNTFANTPLAITAKFSIGGQYNSSNTLYRFFNGSVDEVKAYSRTLTITDIGLRYGTAGVPKVRGDYTDVRLTNSTGTTEYPYWQETDDRYWTKIPSLATGDTTINMYYGNPNATDSSNGDNTFDFFDNFDSGTINATKWTLTGTPVFTGGIVRFTSDQSITGKVNFGTGYILRTNAALFSTFGAGNYASINFNQSPGNVYIDSNNSFASAQRTESYNGSTVQSNNITTSSSFFTYEIQKISGTSAKYYRDSTLLATHTLYLNTGQGAIGFSGSGAGWVDTNWAAVRKYASTEPTHSIVNNTNSPEVTL